MSKYLYGEDIKAPPCGQPCYTPVEDIWEQVERQLCKPRKRCCPPRTRARDAIRVDANERGKCFHYGKKMCDGTWQQSVINHYYKMDIREKGYCDVLMCLPPDKATMDGSICWAWPKELHWLPTGYYEADVYIDNCLCHTHLFYIPECNVNAVPTETVYGDDCQTCSSCGHDDATCGCVKQDCCSKKPEVDLVVEKLANDECMECNEC